ncbi:MAG: 2-oxoglutarate dehydrogenase E1 component [Candidatus Sumerlaeota bacterium]|nr:2-oxoglutarate dehydrogenase E1 component [Candidatus Sumerlaeota bacterium]
MPGITTSLGAMSAEYMEQRYQAWKHDKSSAPPELAAFFEGFEMGQSLQGSIRGQHLQSSVNSLVYHYRSVGHRLAQINPLGGNPVSYPELEHAAYGLNESMPGQVFDTNHIPGLAAEAPLQDIVNHMRETYCGFIGAEYIHIQETAERRWLQERMEMGLNRPKLTRAQRLRVLWKLKRAEMFERFLHSNFKGQKRFSLEGSETAIPAIDFLVEKAPSCGIWEIVIGMTHRGRLNVLANILEKSNYEIFSEFEENFVYDAAYGDGDVKYHKGYATEIETAAGDIVTLTLCDNPSHLEAVGPVVEGFVRAQQASRGDTARKSVLPLILHGDAAFAGQGVVAETFNLSQLKGYRTGGTIHLVINNQVGFTTSPQDYQSWLYATDVAKMASVPIFHVNGDQPDHVLHVMDIALDYRQKFGKDVVVDMWCYRRHGHNEADEPSFTQPLLYEKIAPHPSVVELYTRELIERGEITAADAERFTAQYTAKLDEARRQVHEAGPLPPAVPANDPRWRKIQREYSHEPVETGVPEETLRIIAARCAEIPAGFDVHRKARRQYEDFAKAVEAGGPLNWAAAEALAFGSLLLEGTGVRLSGEDSRRGTFSQRHAVLFDQRTGDQHIPLANLLPGQAQFCCYDSSLAEASVLGFDYGYSLGDPDRLILWEAQFGDFANGAQVIIDQFIAGALSKWDRMSGIVLLLPHGYEGQGPEHSNAWLQRHLSLCAEDNMQVCNPATPAQYFHVLRRQIRRPFRRPLVLMTPKSLLRHPAAVSTLAGLTTGHFAEIIADKTHLARARRVLFCSGKIYYDLIQKLAALDTEDVAIARVDQFYPINDSLWQEITEPCKNADEWVWVSEEPANFGACAFMQRLLSAFYGSTLWYIGRARAASPATVSLALHKRQQARILEFAFQTEKLAPELVDGVAVITQGEKSWHMKSRSPHSENQ